MNNTLITLVFVAFSLSFTQSQDWDYKQKGADWKVNFENCEISQKSPIKIDTSVFQTTTDDEYFFPQINKNIEGILRLEEMNNLLTLNFTANNQQMGTLSFTKKPDFFSKSKKNDDDLEIYNTKCSAITFYMPGEVEIDGETFDLEMKVNCSSVIGDRLEPVYISIPVKKVATGQTKFFDQLKIPTGASLPLKIKIDDFYDLLDPLTVFDTVYRYSGFENFPPCVRYPQWFAIKKVYKINEETFNSLWNLLDLIKNPQGTARGAFDAVDESLLFIYFNAFK